jgi:prevent-host-death family protein
MCYNCVHMKSNRVGVRELRQNLSRYLRRVAKGERLEVTEHGRPVAVLGPLDESESPLRRLVASGRAKPPEGDLVDLAPPKGRVSTKGTEALQELRKDRG